MRTHEHNAARPCPAPGVEGRRRSRRYPVIADRGDAAWLVLLDGSVRPGLGTRFSFRGRIWEIVCDRTPARTFVASPRCS